MHNPTYAHTLLIDSWIRVNEMRRCDFKLTQSLATRSSSCPVERLSSGICRLRQDELSTSSDTEMKRRLSPRHVCRPGGAYVDRMREPAGILFATY
jgi:hypothetical protein